MSGAHQNSAVSRHGHVDAVTVENAGINYRGRVPHPAWVELNYPALAHNLGRLRAHLGDGTDLMAIVKADAYGHGMLQLTQMLARAGVTSFGVAQASEALSLAHAWAETAREDSGAAENPQPRIFSWIYNPGSDLGPLLQAGIELSASTPEQVAQIVAAVKETGQRARVHLKIDTGMGRAGATAADWDALCRAAIAANRDLLIASDSDSPVSSRVKSGPEVGCTADFDVEFDTEVNAEVDAAAEAQGRSLFEIAGVWSHLARADELDAAGNAATAAQTQQFVDAAARCQELLHGMEDAGARPREKSLELPELELHLAASAGILFHPRTHFNLVRAGIALYGLSPDASVADFRQLDLCPVMRLRAHVTQVKRVPAGTPASYGGTWVAPTERWLALVPVGYADGIHRAAAGDPELTRAWLAGAGAGVASDVAGTTGPLPVAAAAFVEINGRNYPLVGRVCMDQMIIDLGPVLSAELTAHALGDNSCSDGAVAPVAPVAVGDVVTLLGADPAGPTADTWAAACGTINYEVVTAITSRLPRVIQWTDGDAVMDGDASDCGRGHVRDRVK